MGSIKAISLAHALVASVTDQRVHFRCGLPWKRSWATLTEPASCSMLALSTAPGVYALLAQVAICQYLK